MKILFKGGQWSNTEDETVRGAVMKYGLHNWGRIASLVRRKTADQCRQRWAEWLDPSIKHGEWANDEEVKLLQLAEAFPSNWRKIAGQIKGRTAAMCQEHYEKLLDRTRGGGAAAAAAAGGEERKLDFAEVDRTWEAKPARADTLELDQYEQDMIDEAVGRLANRKGKKEQRKERERLQKEAKQRAVLQKQREMREAGLGGAEDGGAGAADADDVADFAPISITDLEGRLAQATGKRARKGEKAVTTGLVGIDLSDKAATKQAADAAAPAALRAKAIAEFKFDFGEESKPAKPSSAIGADQVVVPASMRKRHGASRRMLPAASQSVRKQPGVEAPAALPDTLALPSLSAGPAAAAAARKAHSTAGTLLRCLVAPTLLPAPVRPRTTSLLAEVLQLEAASGGDAPRDAPVTAGDADLLREARALVDVELERLLAHAAVAAPQKAGPATTSDAAMPFTFAAADCGAGAFSDDDTRQAAAELVRCAMSSDASHVDAVRTRIASTIADATAVIPATATRGQKVQRLRELRAASASIDAKVSKTPAAKLVAEPTSAFGIGSEDADAALLRLVASGDVDPADVDCLLLQAATSRATVRRAKAAMAQSSVEASVYTLASNAESFVANDRVKAFEAVALNARAKERRLQAEYGDLLATQ